MASPRKFSEKIAQLAQRQAEGNAAFLQIMDDVKSAKQNKPYPRHALHPAPPYARSLPNVNQMSAPGSNIQIQFGDYQGLGGVDSRPDVGGPCRREKKCGGMSPGSSRHSVRAGGSGTNLNWSSPYSRADAAVSTSVTSTSASPMTVVVEKAPVSQPFLSPPPFAEPWKRTLSDSALHTSLVGPNSASFVLHGSGTICVNDGVGFSPHQNHSSSASASPSPPSPLCHQHTGYESPGHISIPCPTNQSSRNYDGDNDETRSVRMIRQESPHFMGMVQTVGCGGEGPMKLIPDSSTSPSGSLPDLNATIHIPPPLTSPLDMDPQQPVFRASVAQSDSARKLSQPTGDVSQSYHQTSMGMNDYEPGSFLSSDLFARNPNFLQYRAPAEPSERDIQQVDESVWGLRSTGSSSPIPIPRVNGQNQIPPCSNQRSNSPCDPHSAPASPSDSSLPGQRALFMNDVLNTLSNAGIDAYAMPNSCPSQTHSVLRQFQRINMVDSSTGTPVSHVDSALINTSVPSIMSNANGAVEVTISSDYTRLLQEASGELSSVVPPLSSNHGIVITLTAPDSSDALNALGVTSSSFDSSGIDLPQDLSDIFGIGDYGASDDEIRADLGPIDVDGFQLLMNPEDNIADAATEDHFRMDRL